MTLNEALNMVNVRGVAPFYRYSINSSDEKELKEAYSVLKKNYDRRLNNIKKDDRFDILPKAYSDFQERAEKQDLLVGGKLKTASQLDVDDLKDGIKSLYGIFKNVEGNVKKEGSVKEYSKELKNIENKLELKGYASAKESERVSFWEYKKQLEELFPTEFFGQYSSRDNIQASYHIYQSENESVESIILEDRLSERLMEYGYSLDISTWSEFDKQNIDMIRQNIKNEINEMNDFKKQLEALKIIRNDLYIQRMRRQQQTVTDFMRRG